MNSEEKEPNEKKRKVGESEKVSEPLFAVKEHEKIRGLFIVREFVDAATEQVLLTHFDAKPWDASMQRRVQHYGYRYDYKARKIDQTMVAEPLPECATKIASRISALVKTDGSLVIDANADDSTKAEEKQQNFDQLIVNEYRPGQGIAAHVDCKPCFRDGIASLSLGSDAVMQFRRLNRENVDVALERRSLIVLTGEARYNWTHAIPGRTSDNGVERDRRVSLTFRTVILS